MRPSQPLFLAIVLALGTSLGAEVRPRGPVTPLEIDENGAPIVKVRLSAKKPGVPDREFRFIFDTGATFCVVDPSIPSDYLWEEPEKPKGASEVVTDGTGRPVAGRPLCLKRLEVGNEVREGLQAYRMDLKRTLLGRIEDEPVDGILGMNFLRGTRFVFDYKAREIRWWQDIPGTRLPLVFIENGSPALLVKVGGTEVPCMLDTGANGGFQMPGNASEDDHPEPFFHASASGEVLEGKSVKLPRLEAGSAAWVDISLDLVKPGEGRPVVGQTVLGAASLGLDFLDEWITFTPDAKGNLPTHRTPARLPLIWERGSRSPRLLAWAVNPSSRWGKAGLKTGDEILAIGLLEGRALTLKAAFTASAQGATTWRIRRNGADRQLEVPAQP